MEWPTAPACLTKSVSASRISRFSADASVCASSGATFSFMLMTYSTVELLKYFPARPSFLASSIQTTGRPLAHRPRGLKTFCRHPRPPVTVARMTGENADAMPWRSLDEADLPAVAELAAVCLTADGGQPYAADPGFLRG